MSAKRTHSEAFELEEFSDVGSVTHTSPKAKIHCFVSEVPEDMKKGKNSNFFDGSLSDGKKSIRVYGYDPEVRRRLFETQKRSERTIILTGCCVKTGRNGRDLEVFVNKQTNVEKSSKKFSVPKEDQTLETKSIDSAATMNVNSKITVEAKIVSKKEPGFVESKQLRIQELEIADSSGSTRLTVWDDVVDKLEVDKSYLLQNVTVREFKGKRFLSTSKMSKVTPIEDIGSIEAPQTEESSTTSTTKHFKNVKIVGVQKFDTYPQCLKCNSKVQEDDDGLGECVRCHLLQDLLNCRKGKMACVIIKCSDYTTLTLRAFDKVVNTIAEKPEDITARDLLRAQPFGMHFEDGIIRSVHRS